MELPEARTTKHWIWDILALNLIVRAVWLWVMHPPQKADFEWYFDHAKMLSQGQGYYWMGHATAYWPIGWPFFLSLVFRITGPHIIVGLAVNVILSTIIVGLIYLITITMFHERAYALAAAIAYSLLPSQIEWNAILGSEELFTALLLVSLYLYIRARATHGRNLWYGIIASGLVLGCAADVRPIPLAFPLFVFLYELIILRGGLMKSLGRGVALCVAMFVTILPVTIRNVIAMHHLVLVSTNGGVNLWQGTHTNGGYYWSWNPYVNPILHITDEIQKNKVAEHAALTHIIHHIPTTIINGFIKMYDLYKDDVNASWYTFHVMPHLDSWTNHVDTFTTSVYFIFMFAAVVGLGILFIRKLPGVRMAILLFAFIVYNTLFFFFFPAWDRFRYPLMPLFAVFVGVGIVVTWREMRKDNQGIAS